MDNLLKTPDFNGLIKGRHGYFVYNKNDVFVGQALEKYGEFSEAEVILFEQVCKPGFYAMDIGANIGTHTLVIAKYVGKDGRVFALEPQTVIFQTLCANLAINSIINTTCYQVAVSNESGFVRLPEFTYTDVANYGAVRAEDYNEGYKVRKITLDDEFKDIAQVDFIKIDVEGMEAKVLLGARELIEKFHPVLYVENDNIDKSKELIELIDSMGYRLYWHTPPLFNPDNYAGDKENIYKGIMSVNLLCIPKSFDTTLSGFQEVSDSNYHPLRGGYGEN